MPKLICDNPTLLNHLPNVFATVKGEISLYDKIKEELDVVENWIIDTFCSSKSYNSIAGYVFENPIRINCVKLLAVETLRRALPSLDLVLTPNGFGVVSTQNIAPASRERVNALLLSLQEERNRCLTQLVDDLVGVSQWLNSPQGAFFQGSLFPSFRDFESLPEMNEATDKWAKYQELRSRAIDIENSIADDYISHGVLDLWRTNYLRDNIDPAQLDVLNTVRLEVINVLRGNPLRTNKMFYLVNSIRNNASLYNIWKCWDTAKIYSPPVFENKKENKGYWF